MAHLLVPTPPVGVKMAFWPFAQNLGNADYFQHNQELEIAPSVGLCLLGILIPACQEEAWCRSSAEYRARGNLPWRETALIFGCHRQYCALMAILILPIELSGRVGYGCLRYHRRVDSSAGP